MTWSLTLGFRIAWNPGGVGTKKLPVTSHYDLDPENRGEPTQVGPNAKGANMYQE